MTRENEKPTIEELKENHLIRLDSSPTNTQQILTYKSLYDIIELTKEFQAYSGTLESVFADVERILRKKVKTRQDYSRLAFQVPRMLRGIVDYKNKHPDDPHALRLVRRITAVCLDIYEQYDNRPIKDTLLELKEAINQANKAILRTELEQHHDFINLIASKPELSRKTARTLHGFLGNKQAILLAIGHGAINIGLDVILNYQDISGTKNILFHPMRYSTSKHKKYEDSEPRLTPAEITYLQRQAERLEIIIFDENCCTGETMINVVDYVSKKVFPKHKINILYNIDTSNLK